jgi:hypothetical protein
MSETSIGRRKISARGSRLASVALAQSGDSPTKVAIESATAVVTNREAIPIGLWSHDQRGTPFPCPRIDGLATGEREVDRAARAA